MTTIIESGKQKYDVWKEPKPLTKKQAHIYQFLVDYIQDNGFPPTMKEIAEEFKISIVTVWQYLQTMKQKGAITRERYRWNSIILNL